MKTLPIKNLKAFVRSLILLIVIAISQFASAQVKLLAEVEITDSALFFDGVQSQTSNNQSLTGGYDFAYARAINPHGDCVDTYKQFVFMTWYRGGKGDRHVMLSRYNTVTGTMKTIEFPHQHTGFNGKWWIGETHNTIAVGICPRNGTIHMVYDMHAYGNGGSFVNDYFRYSYSLSNVADIADEEFTLDKFVKDPIDGDYKHCTMSGTRNPGNFTRLTYPEFFLNDDGELFLKMRRGTSYDGAMVFIKYDDANSKWGLFKNVTALGAKAKGASHDWSIYGTMKFSGGKMRLGFQRRLRDGSDKYAAQNGVYYAYSDDPTGASQWKNHKGEPMTFPLVDATEVLIMEPGDSVETTQKDMVYIVGGFDFEVTDRGDEHIISMVKDRQYNVTKKFHTYRRAGESEFTTVQFDAGSELYAAGNDIYVIGLKNGRANVVKTEGGTSDFKEVYQHTSGPTFQKGRIHIDQGKLYYYLLKDGGSGDKRTTVLQVFDLDIPKTGAYGPYGYAHAANEGDNIEVTSTVDIAYGAKGNYTYLYDQTEDCGCDSITFGSNPAPDEERHCYVKPVVFADGVSLDKAKHAFLIGQTFQLKATISPMNTKNQTLSWSSLDPSIAQVNSDGEVEAKALGTTTIVVKTDDGGFTDSCEVKVVEVLYPNVIYFDAEQASSPAKNLVDGNASDASRWSAQVFPKSIVVDYGETKSFTGSAVHPYQNRAYHFTIAISDSANSGFVTVVDQSGAVSELPIKNSFSATTGRYVKLTVTGATGYTSNWVSIQELEMFYEDVVNSINDAFRMNKIKVCPNPSSGMVYFSGADVQQARVFTLSGQRVKDFAVSSNQVDLSELPGGMYLIQLEEANGLRVINKIVLE